MAKKQKKRWIVPAGQPLTSLDTRILELQDKGILVPTRDLIKTPEQIEGIRQAGIINTAALDLAEREIKEGMTTAALDKMIHDFIISKGAIPACLNYEGFPKSCCISINEVVCHGIPSEEEEFFEGDIVNVDITTIYNGYYADASRMFIIGRTSPECEKLVRVAKECLQIGMETAKPWGFVGEIGKAIEKHARKNGYSVVRDLAGHGTGLAFIFDLERFLIVAFALAGIASDVYVG